jgi:hypothetical protein
VRWLLLAVVGSTFSCANVLGLDDAKLDPDLASNQGGEGGAPVGGSGAGETTSSVGGADAGAGGSGGRPPSTPVCETYCTIVMQECAGAHAVYTTPEICHAVCAHLPEGEEGDEIGNTAHCRLRNAKIAGAEPSFYCPIAGPGGNGVCGSNCQGMCTIAAGACSAENGQWPNDAACHTECNALSDLDTFTVDPAMAMYAGDHVQCRLFHASASALAEPGIHCPHVGGSPPCAASTGEGGGS